MIGSEVDSKFGYEFTDGNMNIRTIFVRLTRYEINEVIRTSIFICDFYFN